MNFDDSFFGGKQINTQKDAPEQTASSEVNVAVGLLFVDNYQEALDSMTQEKLPVFAALIDRKLNVLCHDLGGILCKYEKDRYMCLFENNAVEQLKKKKFEILDQIRETNLGNTVPVTLSIGIGQGGETLSQCMEFARNALDLALGRGGDQALIKDKESYQFYGGKANAVEKNSNVRARVKSFALMELIKDSPNVFVMGHKRADLDSFGASIGICAMANHFGKKAYIIIDSVNISISRLHEKLMEINDYKEKIINSEKAEKIFRKNSLLVIVDTHRASICESPELAVKAENVVVIDHHRSSADFLDSVLSYHEPYASSASELVCELLQYAGDDLSLKAIEADALLAGITMDTKRFSLKTGAKTFEAASYLKRKSADTVRVRILMQNDMESFKARTEIVRNAQIFRDYIAISVCPDTPEGTGLVAAMAADELLNIVGIKVSFVLTITDADILISARSLGDVNVHRIMEKLGGGGHQTVAGAQLPLVGDMDADKAIQMIKDATIDYLEKEN